MKSISIVRLLIFAIISITLSIIYYKKILKVESGGNKKLLMLTHILGLLSLFGLLSIFSSIKGSTGKTIILVFVVLIINIFNINQSITKCGYPTLYKVNLFGKSSFIIIIISLLIYYSYEDNFFRFLYAESELDSSSKSLTNKFTVDELKDKFKILKMPPYCPDFGDMGDDKYKTTKKWKKLSSKHKKNCLATYSSINERKDITDKIYA